MSFSSQESFFVTLCWYKHVSLFSAVLVVDLSLLQPLTYLLDEHPLIILRLLFKYLFYPTIKNEFIFPTVELHYGLQGPEMSVSQIASFHTTPLIFFFFFFNTQATPPVSAKRQFGTTLPNVQISVTSKKIPQMNWKYF